MSKQTIFEKATELKEKNKFSMRSCWECNPAHKYLKKVRGLFVCFSCGRWWMNGDFLNNEKHRNKPYKKYKRLKIIELSIKL